jgi:hypothetical protein
MPNAKPEETVDMSPISSERSLARVALAERIAGEYEAANNAHADVLEQKAMLLEQVVRDIAPALPALSSARRVEERMRDGQVRSFERGPKAFRVYGRGPQRTLDEHGSSERNFSGSLDLFLNPDGTWTETHYEGTWGRGPLNDGLPSEDASHWKAVDGDLSVCDVAERYPLQAILMAIAEEMERQTGSRERTTEKALRQAAKLRAIVELCRS